MNLQTKLIVIILSLVLLPLLLLLFIAGEYTKSVLLDDKVRSINTVLDQEVSAGLGLLAEYQSITRLTAQYPPIQGIIRASATGVDPVDGSSLKQWKLRLQSIFGSQLREFPFAYQIRFIGSDGHEIVRVQKSNGVIEAVSEEELQDKSARDYFRRITEPNQSEVYVSPADFNVEHGEIQHPLVSTIRMCRRIENSADGSFAGVVVINYNAARLFALLSDPLFGEVFMIDQDGYYIAHQNSAKLFGFQTGSEENYFNEQPELRENLQRSHFLTYKDAREREIRIWRKIYYQSDDPARFWVIVHTLREEVFMDVFRIWGKVFAVIVVFFVLLIGVIAAVLARRFIAPVVAMSNVADRVSADQTEFRISSRFTGRNDEIGRLARSLQRMGQELIDYNQKLDHTVKERTAELQEALAKLEELSGNLEQEVERKTQELTDAGERLVRQEKLAAMGKLAGIVGHELRGPLGVILNSIFFIKLRLKDHQDEKVDKHVRIIQEEINTANTIIEDTLDFARAKDPTLDVCNIVPLIDDALERRRIPDNITVESTKTEDVCLVRIDAAQMRRVFFNLIQNAVQAMEEGGKLSISVDLKMRDAKDWVIVRIADSGPGVPLVLQEKIFEPLYTTKIKGTGLGLAICRAIVQAHGGRLDLENRPGQGAVFVVELPSNQ
ncbi:MAG: HAMP domain-containing protein [Candidatus Omnitrophica bacterium]|nr:HAMP domain-containing protein [Candidatus Omnitrophota bacterium]MCB9720001.1 HAMP domain-containing protein [Candidatus Omnitrophota bacterium]